MDWNELRQEWREHAPAARLLAVEEIRALDGSLWKQVRRRDLIETIAGIAVLGIFGTGALRAMLAGEWVAAAFGLLVAAWGASLPFQLKRSRPAHRDVAHGAPVLAYLRGQRDAALAQARMLERVWLWYLTPPGIGLVGLTLATDGPTPGALGYIAAVLLLYGGLAWLNRHVARTQFRAHADALQRQIEALEGDGG